jgi:hypothetical protein
MKKFTLIRIGLVLFFVLAVIEGIIAGRDVGHKDSPPPPAARAGQAGT